jgi:hypothetical protein
MCVWKVLLFFFFLILIKSDVIEKVKCFAVDFFLEKGRERGFPNRIRSIFPSLFARKRDRLVIQRG